MVKRPLHKQLIVINGTMGVGKTSVCQRLFQSTDHSAWVDGDWCWKVFPFRVEEGDKATILDNIAFLLNSYLAHDRIDVIYLSWVIPQADILEAVLNRIHGTYHLVWFTLTADEEAILKRRLKQRETEGGDEFVAVRSLRYLAEYFRDMRSIRIDTTHKSIEQVAQNIREHLNNLHI